MALRLSLLLALLLPMPALAQDAFCTSLRRLVAAAPGSFASIPESERLFDGAVREWRERNMAPNWEGEASFNVIPLEHASAERRYGALLQDVPRCIPALRALRQMRLQQQHGIIWRMPGVEKEMILDRPTASGGVFSLQFSVMRLRA